VPLAGRPGFGRLESANYFPYKIEFRAGPGLGMASGANACSSPLPITAQLWETINDGPRAATAYARRRPSSHAITPGRTRSLLAEPAASA
jgi:hypothetical protein